MIGMEGVDLLGIDKPSIETRAVNKLLCIVSLQLARLYFGTIALGNSYKTCDTVCGGSCNSLARPRRLAFLR